MRSHTPKIILLHTSLQIFNYLERGRAQERHARLHQRYCGWVFTLFLAISTTNTAHTTSTAAHGAATTAAVCHQLYACMDKHIKRCGQYLRLTHACNIIALFPTPSRGLWRRLATIVHVQAWNMKNIFNEICFTISSIHAVYFTACFSQTLYIYINSQFRQMRTLNAHNLPYVESASIQDKHHNDCDHNTNEYH